ncbi:MAG: class I SAM-dependent methyltransferase [Planctomycetota bacterium]
MTAAAALPDHFPSVAHDVIAYCGDGSGRVWVDLGSGAGGLGFALLDRLRDATLVLVDPNADTAGQALAAARRRGVAARVVVVIAPAEAIPLAEGSVDVVVSRGSFYFWSDRAQGLREVWRILRPGGRAMIGGGLGSAYPAWARREFIRRRRASARSPDEVRAFAEARSPETFGRLADEAGLAACEVLGEGGLSADDPNAGLGIWLRFAKTEVG